ncbi:MAG: ATP-dependent DNA helicase RecG [Alphaproteobacteria bacterium]|nr:ATP-dependent DNA helicase RecG [Alphaproteobacteria bacterium]
MTAPSRTSPLAPLLAPFPAPRGARRETVELVEKIAGGRRVIDVLLTMPHGAVDRRNKIQIADAREGELATIEAEVDAHLPSPSAKSPYRVRLRDETGFLSVAYFRPKGDMMARLYPVGQRRIISGKIDLYNGERQMLHPDHVVDPSGGEAPPDVEPVYPLTAGLPLRTLQRVVAQALTHLAELPEWLDPTTPKGHRWPSFAEALRGVHRPNEPDDVAPAAPGRTRLAYDELFARQCALRLRRAHRQDSPGRAIVGDGRLAQQILAALPYKPTRAQERALGEIRADMAKPAPMLRLLQGDVGSGKTLVAALAMATAAEAGLQSALMAPTDLLARQHGAGLLPLLQSAGLNAVVLTGRDKAKDRERAADALARGDIDVVIGTHALFQERVSFHDLGLIIIDEQHRFGVSDRRRLVEKGEAPHVLVMSATPIPRTLALAVHGDMDLSVLDEKPPGRQPIATRAMPTSRLEEVVEAVSGAAERGERAYWVCPLIEESEAVDLAAAQDRYDALKERFGDGVELVHGKMSASAREAAMDRFRSGQSFLLVATTVIEVGVDVPEATIMVIEHAERFGLAQLHQLRGRVGRGGRPGYCVLLWRPPLSEGAKERIDTLRRSDDGFAIAEADYKMRGAGDMLGVQQSGLPPFRLVDPEAHGAMLEAADKEARLAIDRDPTLETARGRAIALLLELFGHDEAAALARSG